MDGFPFFGGGGQSVPPPADGTTIDLGGYDTLLGRTYAEIGSHARSMHKCQGMSQLVALPGHASARYRLVETTIPGQTEHAETSMFEGVDTSIEGLRRFVAGPPPPGLDRALSEIADAARRGREAFERGDNTATRSRVVAGLESVRRLRGRLLSFGLDEGAAWEIDFRLAQKERQFERAVVLAHSLRIEALADDGIVTPGQALTVSALVANRGSVDVAVRGVRLSGFEGLVEPCLEETLAPAGVYRCSSELQVPNDTAPTGIHWTHVPSLARYAYEPDVPFGVPFRPTPFTATFELEFESIAVSVERPISYRDGDDLFAGEKQTTLNVVPRLSVDVSPGIAIIPRRAGGSHVVCVTVSNAWSGPGEGVVGLVLPIGWTADPMTQVVRFSREDERRTVRFTVLPGGARVGEHSIAAFAQMSGARYDSGYQVVEYPHIGRRHLSRRAQSTVKVIDVSLPDNLVVGYVEGVGDAVPPAIVQLGASVELIDADALAWGDLTRFDVIVTGVRVRTSRGPARQQRSAARVCARRWDPHRSVQQVRIQRGTVRTVRR